MKRCISFVAVMLAIGWTFCFASRCLAADQPNEEGKKLKENKIRALYDECMDPPALLTAKPLEPAKGDDELRKLLKALYNERLTFALSRYKKDGPFDTPFGVQQQLQSAQRLLTIGLQLYDTPEEKNLLLKGVEEFGKKAAAGISYMELSAQLTGAAMPTPEALEQARHQLREFELEVQIQRLKVHK
jgi:hypothetical protein